MARSKRFNHEGTIIRRKDGRYEWRRMIDGELQCCSAMTMPLLQKKIEAYKGRGENYRKMKVSSLFSSWLERHIKPLKRAATYDQYNSLYMTHIEPEIGKMYVHSVRTADVQRVISSAAQKNLSTQTMEHIKKVMSCGFKYAIDMEEIIKDNPVNDKIQIPSRTPKPRKVLLPEEFAAIMNVLKKSRWYHSVWFDISTGLRRGELLALRISDVNVENRRATIRHSLDAKGRIGDTKESEEHYVPLTALAIKSYESQIDMLKREGNPSVFRNHLANDAWLFPNKHGDALIPASYTKLIARAAEKCGIHASPHMLRHSFVYYNRKAIDKKTLQNILGHDSSTTTDDIYGLFISDDVVETAQALDPLSNQFEDKISSLMNPTKQQNNVVRFEQKKAK